MQPHEVRSAAQARAIVEERGLTHVKVGVFDIDGILRGKYVHRDKFLSALERAWASATWCWAGTPTTSSTTTSASPAGTPPIPTPPCGSCPRPAARCRSSPQHLLFLGEFAGTAEELCPRGVLRRVLERAAAMGYEASAGSEYEFFVFDETPACVREKNYRNLSRSRPASSATRCCATRVHTELYQELLALCETMACASRACTPRPAPACSRRRCTYSEALEAADKAALFKIFTKVLAQRRGWIATFMAKWSQDWPGQSGHMHMSLSQGRQAGVPRRIAAARCMPDACASSSAASRR